MGGGVVGEEAAGEALAEEAAEHVGEGEDDGVDLAAAAELDEAVLGEHWGIVGNGEGGRGGVLGALTGQGVSLTLRAGDLC